MSVKYVYFNSHNKEVPYCYLSPEYFAKITIKDETFLNLHQYIEHHRKSEEKLNLVELKSVIYQGYKELFDQHKDFLYNFKQISNNDKVKFIYANANDSILGIGFSASQALFNKHKWGQNLIGQILDLLYVEFKKENV